jgi:hypothetical protein
MRGENVAATPGATRGGDQWSCAVVAATSGIGPELRSRDSWRVRPPSEPLNREALASWGGKLYLRPTLAC